MRVLLHTCCGPCATSVVAALREEGREVVGYYYNPNIHPAAEHERRGQSLAAVGEAMDVPLIWSAPQDDLAAYLQVARPFGPPSRPSGLETVAFREGSRCQVCFNLRLREAARRAAAEKFPAFTTSLLISPYQDQKMLRRAAEAAASEFGVEFVYRDYRPLYPDSRSRARALGLYLQKYCGCIFSETERLQAIARRRRGGAPLSRQRTPP